MILLRHINVLGQDITCIIFLLMCGTPLCSEAETACGTLSSLIACRTQSDLLQLYTAYLQTFHYHFIYKSLLSINSPKLLYRFPVWYPEICDVICKCKQLFSELDITPNLPHISSNVSFPKLRHVYS